MISEKHIHWLATGAAATLAAFAVRNALENTWNHFLHDEDDTPENPADDDVSWSEALAFAALSGLLVGVTRVIARRGATAALHAYLGHEPEGTG